MASSFLDDLNWVYCLFCFKKFTREGRFFVLSCRKVACIDCAKKMISKTEEKRIDCSICKKLVSLCQIREEMPENIRDFFRSEMVFAAQIVNNNKQCEQLNEMRLKNMNSGHMRKMEERRTRIAEYKNISQKCRQPILRTISENHLGKLLTFPVDQLQTMNISQILDTTRSQRHPDQSLRQQHRDQSNSKRSSDSRDQLIDGRLQTPGLGHDNNKYDRNTTTFRRNFRDLTRRENSRDQLQHDS